MIHDSIQLCNIHPPLVSVIIPVYNTEDFIIPCLDSVLAQTYKYFEIICVSDGSTDISVELIRRKMAEDDRIHLLQIENHGQGYARNLALKVARGEYILFLDSDDYIESVTLDVAVAHAEKDQSDFVVFDWRYYKPEEQINDYKNRDPFFSKTILRDEECLELLEVDPVFTVNKLYRKQFLFRNDIFYADAYLYEDNPFWIRAVMRANIVSLIHSPLYRVTIHESSSTKSNWDSDMHYRSYIAAVKSCIDIIFSSERKLSPYHQYIFVRYLLNKFLIYYGKRTPDQYKDSFRREFVDLLSAFTLEDFERSQLLSLCIKNKTFENKDYSLFEQQLNYWLVERHELKKLQEAAEAEQQKLENERALKTERVQRLLVKLHLQKPVLPAPKITAPLSRSEKYELQLKQPFYPDVILFFGMDHRYTGNSRYLFEQMIHSTPPDVKLLFITNDPHVPLEYRIKPYSERADRMMARSKVVIFESWIPKYYKKRSEAKWIQLWHGTPLKKLLFDSNEKNIYEKHRLHKISKFNDIQNWNYLLTDNDNVSSYFETAFLMDSKRILPYGYPRVRYLKQNQTNTSLKQVIRDSLHIENGKKTVVFLPTWRDYNYEVSEDAFNQEYLPDLEKLQTALGDSYTIIYKDHPYLSRAAAVHFPNYCDAETQELLLVADVLLTDYSSVLFDALAVDIPVVLFCKDFPLMEASRGVYNSLWSDLEPLVCTEEKLLPQVIKNCESKLSIYAMLKERYTRCNVSDQALPQFILNLL